MKITPVIQSGRAYNINFSKDSKKAELGNKYAASSTLLPNNSLNEVMGRAQVSFGGTNKMGANYFTHDCSEILSGKNEHIDYNKEDGSFIHTVTARNGDLVKKEEFYPLEGREVITRVRRDGLKVTERRKNAGQTVTHFNQQGTEVYRSETDANGNTETKSVDFEKNRIVLISEKDGNYSAQVIDLRTKQPVTSGELIYDERYDEKKQEYSKVNILTNRVEETKKYRDGELVSQKSYSPLTGEITEEVRFKPYVKVNYSADGHPQFITTLSEDEKIKDIYELYQDGKTEKSHTKYILDGLNKRVRFKISYFPATQLKKEITSYGDSGKTVEKYHRNPNVVEQRYEYDKDDNLVKILNFDIFSQSVSGKTIFAEDGSYKEESYSPDGIKRGECFYTPNSRLSIKNEYDNYTGVLKYTTRYHEDGSYDVTRFDKSGKIAKTVSIYTKDKKLKETITLDKTGQRPAYREVYNQDGSYTLFEYDGFGNIKSTSEWNIDGSRKSSSAASSAFNSTTKLRDRVSDEDKFLKKMSDIIARTSYAGVKNEDWQRLAKILGVNDKSDLLSMDKTTYRKLSRQYHPDHNPDNQQRNTTIFGIINNLYSNQSN